MDHPGWFVRKLHFAATKDGIMKDERCDVLVVGAGPAGLAIGAELCREHQVVVVDYKQELGATNKSWLVPAFVLRDYAPELLSAEVEGESLVDGVGLRRFLTMTLNTRTRQMSRCEWPSELEHGYYFAKEHRVLEYFGQRIAKEGAERGSRVELGTTFFDHRVLTRGTHPVQAQTSRGRIEARLLIDASGPESMIRAKYDRLPKPQRWWSVYGGLYHHPHGFGSDHWGKPMLEGDYLLWGTFKDTNPDVNLSLEGGHPVFEYELFTGNVSFPMVLYLRTSRVPKEVMKAEFEHIIRQEEFASPFRDCQEREPKWGWYPSGIGSSRFAEDHVLFVGTAGNWNAPCGWGATFILGHYIQYAKRIDRLLHGGALHRRHLEKILRFPPAGAAQRVTDDIVVQFFACAPARLINKFIGLFGDDPGQIPFIYCERLFTLSLRPEDLVFMIPRCIKHFSLAELVQIIPPRLMPRLIADMLALGMESAATVLRRLLHRSRPSRHGLIW